MLNALRSLASLCNKDSFDPGELNLGRGKHASDRCPGPFVFFSHCLAISVDRTCDANSSGSHAYTHETAESGLPSCNEVHLQLCDTEL